MDLKRARIGLRNAEDHPPAEILSRRMLMFGPRNILGRWRFCINVPRAVLSYIKLMRPLTIRPMKTLFFSPERCIDCSICELICSLTSCGECTPSKSFIRVFRNQEVNDRKIVLLRGCNLCAGEEKCIKFCPTQALEFVGGDRAPTQMGGRRLRVSIVES
jgi:ferredoxin